MQEIECKILEVDKKQIVRKLLALGAKKKFEGVVEGVLMDYPNHSMKKKGMLLRLRSMGEKNFLTFKIAKGKIKKWSNKKDLKKAKAKICTEIEFEVGDLAKMRRVLELMGLAERHYMKKHRTSYSLGKTHFEFDKYLGERKSVPLFLEIEAHSIKEIHKYAALLGFTKEQCLPWSAWDVMDHYSKNKK